MLDDEDKLLVDLIHIPTEENKPSWNRFYFIVVDYDENHKMRKDLYNKLRNEEEWTNERMKTFWIYHHDTKQPNAPYESIKEDEWFNKLWDDEHPALDSSTSGGDVYNEEEQAKEEAKTSTSFAQ